ncbi:pilus assembly protein TadG-related protein [Microbacterium sp. 179-I 3D4 NHS]|uniref:pilus assembly protein TadG-related protein n=1 Tax=Microbacterium sp. 179-I 3D4 NHS TaxID=3142381 RepID=UPI0039A28E09
MTGDARRDEEGSVLLLTLGYVLLALAAVWVCVSATDLYLAQKRVDAVADAASLAGADGFAIVLGDGTVLAELTDDAVRIQAAAILDAHPGDVHLVEASAPDGTSARVTVSALWHPPLFSPLIPDGLLLRATATTRTALQ